MDCRVVIHGNRITPRNDEYSIRIIKNPELIRDFLLEETKWRACRSFALNHMSRKVSFVVHHTTREIGSVDTTLCSEHTCLSATSTTSTDHHYLFLFIYLVYPHWEDVERDIFGNLDMGFIVFSGTAHVDEFKCLWSSIDDIGEFFWSDSEHR